MSPNDSGSVILDPVVAGSCVDSDVVAGVTGMLLTSKICWSGHDGKG